MAKAKRNLGAISADAALHDLAESFPSTKSTRRPVKSAPSLTSQEPEHPLTVRIPMYVATGMRRAHAETGKSHRIIVLEALKAWGISVRDDDLVERRRRG